MFDLRPRHAGGLGRGVVRIDDLDLSGRCAEAITDAERLAPLRVDNTAYVMFTRGPPVSPRGWWSATRVCWGGGGAAYGVRVGRGCAVLMVAAPTFDASIFDFLWAVGSGAALVVAPPRAFAGEALTTLLQVRGSVRRW